MKNWIGLAVLTLMYASCGSTGGGGYRYYGDLATGAGHDGAAPEGDLGAAGHDLRAGANCADGVKNGHETDVDCGGPDCGPCADGRRCLMNSDCANRQCTAGFCVAAASCSDGVKNGGETDVDCGGADCSPCANGSHCVLSRDCSSNTCANGQCVDGCSDGIQDGQETDVDCGGPTCGGCGTGRSCLQARDCSNQNCTTGICCGLGTANCDGIKTNGCNVNLNTNAQHCGSCAHACVNGQSCANGTCSLVGPMMVGSYSVVAGPPWANMPPVVSCVDECAKLYGGVAANYSCSTSAVSDNHMATVVCYGVAGCQVHADTYKVGTTYIAGACSAYIADGNCAAATNYCWR